VKLKANNQDEDHINRKSQKLVMPQIAEMDMSDIDLGNG